MSRHELGSYTNQCNFASCAERRVGGVKVPGRARLWRGREEGTRDGVSEGTLAVVEGASVIESAEMCLGQRGRSCAKAPRRDEVEEEAGKGRRDRAGGGEGSERGRSPNRRVGGLFTKARKGLKNGTHFL